MTSADPPMAATAMPPPMALARQMMSGVTPVKPVAPPGPAVRPGLDLVEGQQGTVGVQQFLEPGQVAGLAAG